MEFILLVSVGQTKSDRRTEMYPHHCNTTGSSPDTADHVWRKLPDLVWCHSRIRNVYVSLGKDDKGKTQFETTHHPWS